MPLFTKLNATNWTSLAALKCVLCSRLHFFNLSPTPAQHILRPRKKPQNPLEIPTLPTAVMAFDCGP